MGVDDHETISIFTLGYKLFKGTALL